MTCNTISLVSRLIWKRFRWKFIDTFEDVCSLHTCFSADSFHLLCCIMPCESSGRFFRSTRYYYITVQLQRCLQLTAILTTAEQYCNRCISAVSRNETGPIHRRPGHRVLLRTLIGSHTSPVQRNHRRAARRRKVPKLRLVPMGGSVAEWLACWTQAQKGLGSNRSLDAVG